MCKSTHVFTALFCSGPSLFLLSRINQRNKHFSFFNLQLTNPPIRFVSYCPSNLTMISSDSANTKPPYIYLTSSFPASSTTERFNDIVAFTTSPVRVTVIIMLMLLLSIQRWLHVAIALHCIVPDHNLRLAHVGTGVDVARHGSHEFSNLMNRRGTDRDG